MPNFSSTFDEGALPFSMALVTISRLLAGVVK